MNNRVTTKQVPYPPDKALKQRLQEIEYLLDDLLELVATPLPATRTEYIEVKPGEPGYNDAVYEVNWCTHPLRFKQDATGQFKPVK